MTKRIQLGNGIYLNLIQTDKFKSNLLSYYLIRPLDREEVTKNALLPSVLKRGNMRFNTNLEIEKELEQMYGANLSMAINKRGERHVLRFTMEWANGDYFGDSDFNLNAINMLRDIIYNPYIENESFKKEYVDGEKENLKNKIQAKINDKRSYAINRCLEEMCKYEKFSLYSLGYVEDLDKIDEKTLYEHYQTVLATSTIEIFYVGSYDDKLMNYLVESNKVERDTITIVPREPISFKIKTKNMVVERFDVNQGKLVLGFRTGIPFEDKLYNGLLIASDILGGGPNSKLFKHVREEHSLAYYISTSTLKYKSIVLIDAGIEFENYDKTVEIIKAQLADLKAGIFEEDDIDISKKSIKTSTESIKDSLFLMAEFGFSQIVAGDNRSLEEVLEDFEKVSKEQISEAANQLVLDTIYFMKKLA